MFKKLLIIFLIIIAAVIVYAVSVSSYICISTKNRIVELYDTAQMDDVDYVLVLGCSAKGSKPSPMLEDRILTSVDVYNNDHSKILLMSGDHLKDDYNEVGVMSRVAKEYGVPDDNIEEDRYGLSTYDSLWRLKNLYNAKKIIIVTQKYHLYRSLYLAKKLGLDAYGVSADLRTYSTQLINDCREFLARNKDFLYVIDHPDALVNK